MLPSRQNVVIYTMYGVTFIEKVIILRATMLFDFLEHNIYVVGILKYFLHMQYLLASGFVQIM